MEGKLTFLLVLVGCATLVRSSNLYDIEDACEGQKHGALIPHPEDCTKFIQCVWGKPHIHKCPSGLHFDAKKKVCNHPSDAQCEIGRVAIEVKLSTVDNHDDDLIEACKGQPYGALVAHPHSCSKFLYCLGSTVVVRDCPAGLHFNPKIRVCDWPYMVDCKQKQSPLSVIDQFSKKYSFISVDDDLSDACKDQPHGALVAHPHSCSKFLYCLGSSPAVRDCPAGLHFNPKLKVCDWPQNAGCTLKQSPSSIKQFLKKYSLIHADDALVQACEGKPFGDLVAHPHFCTKFLYCMATPVVRDCPAGLHFNPKLKVCDWPQNAGCEAAPTTTPEPTEPTTETEPPGTTEPTTETEPPETTESTTEAETAPTESNEI